MPVKEFMTNSFFLKLNFYNNIAFAEFESYKTETVLFIQGFFGEIRNIFKKGIFNRQKKFLAFPSKVRRSKYNLKKDFSQ